MYTLRGRDLSSLKWGSDVARAAAPEECCVNLTGAQPHLPSPFHQDGESKAWTMPLPDDGNCDTQCRCEGDARSQSKKSSRRPGSAPGIHNVKGPKKLVTPRASAPSKTADLPNSPLAQRRRRPNEPEHISHAAEDTEAQLRKQVAKLEHEVLQHQREEYVMTQLRKQHQELTERVYRQNQHVKKLQEKLKQNEETMKGLMDNEKARINNMCTAPCCLPVVRLEKAGLNTEQVCELRADWAGYVFGQVCAQIQNCGQTLREIFKKHERNVGTLDEVAFKAVIRQFLPDFKEDQLTRLFFFADQDGSGKFDFLEFMRIFGNDLTGSMSEEYFEYIMSRIFKVLEQKGGLLNVYRKRERNIDGLMDEQEVFEIFDSLALGLTRKEMHGVLARLDKTVSGQYDVHAVDNALRLCASARFVTEDWVKNLFEQVLSALQRNAESLRHALKQAMDQGYITYDSLTSFAREFQPSLKKTQIDRLFWFLDKNRNGRVPLDDFFQVACCPTLGSAKGNDSRMPSEVMERFCSHLITKCGNLARAFDELDPFVSEENFEICLKGLGFAEDTGFRRLFHLIDINRNGKVQKREFLQILGRYAARAPDGLPPQIPEDGSHDAENEGKGKQAPSSEINLLDEGIKTIDISSPEQVDRLKRDYQRVINRLFVMENELYWTRQKVSKQQQESLVDQSLQERIRELERANRALHAQGRSTRLEQSLSTGSLKTKQKTAQAKAGLEENCSASAGPGLGKNADQQNEENFKPIRRIVPGEGESDEEKGGEGPLPEADNKDDEHQEGSPEIKATKRPKVGRQDSAKLTSDCEVEELLEIIEQLNIEKARQQQQITELVLKQAHMDENEMEAEQLTMSENWNPSAPSNHHHVPVKKSVSSALETSANADESAENARVTTSVRLALRQYCDDGDAEELMLKVKGVTVGGRFVIRELLALESDAAVFKCNDAFLRRNVSVKIPFNDNDMQTRCNFLRECCIYSVLGSVAEVQDVFHFPGMSDAMIYCTMELLNGTLLADRFRSVSKHLQPPTFYEAAEICDALLHGISECHARDVMHLDIKPSVIWEVQQPANVVVKILDFGLARLKDNSSLADEAQIILGKGFKKGELEDPKLEVDANEAPQHIEEVPDPNTRKWAEFAPFASFDGVGTPWFMSPARWCAFAEKYEKINGSTRQMRWDSRSKSRCVKLGQVEEGVENVIASIRNPLEEGKRTIVAAIPALQVYEGSYFEAVLLKDWPLEKLHDDPSSADGPIGLGIGFARMPEDKSQWRLPERAFEMTEGVVVGYDGRVYAYGEDLGKTAIYDEDEEDEGRVTEDDDRGRASVDIRGSSRGSVDTAWMRRRSTTDGDGDGDEPTGPPLGPLGWSFAELHRGDRIGLMATHDGRLRIYVNDLERFNLRIHGLDGSLEWYPVLELCGRAREVLLEPFPVVPAVLKQDGGLAMLRQKTYQLSRHAVEPYADLWACGMIARLCFSSAVKSPPDSFLNLLASAQRWIDRGRQSLDTRGDFLKALWDWFDEDKKDALVDVHPGVASVLQKVFSLDQTHDELMTADEFRYALNAETAWSHMSPEFLVSHLKALGESATDPVNPQKKKPEANSDAGYGASSTGVKRIKKPKSSNEVFWDLSPWRLSASHIRRLVKILQSSAGKRIDVVNVMRFEGKIPPEMFVKLVECLRQPEGINGLEEEGNKAKPQLQFGSTRLPLEDCRIPFQEMSEVNATGLVLHFVQRLNLSRGPEDLSLGMGPAGAAIIADALQNNRALLELNLRGQQIGEEGAKALGLALQSDIVLRKLDLSSNHLGPSGVKEVADALSSDGLSLESLEISMNSILDEGCQYLSRMLQENPALRTLILQRNDIGPMGAVSLGCALLRNDALEVLDIGRNDIDGTGAGSLLRVGRSNVSLTELNLQDNHLDLSAAEKIADALAAPAEKTAEPNMNLRQSLFAGRRETLAGGKPADGRTSERRGTINFAPSASERKKREPGLQGIAEPEEVPSSKHRQSLASGKVFEKMSSHAEENASVDPNRRRNTQLQQPGREIPLWNTLRRLSLRRNDLGSEGAVRIFLVLKNNNRMLAVNIAWNGLGKIAARAWADLFTPQSRCMIEEWDLRDNFLGDEAALGHYLATVAKSLPGPPSSHSSSVRWLNLANNRLDDQGIGHLAEAMPLFAGLEVLLLYNNPDLCTSRSGKWKALMSEGTSGHKKNFGTGEFRGISTLTKALGPSLRILKLGTCALGDEGAAAACRSLVGHPALAELDLSDNGIGQTSLQKVQQTMCDLMRSTRTLKQLCLALNLIGDDLAMKLLQCLCVECPGLDHLDLSANGLSQDLKIKVRDKVKAEDKSADAENVEQPQQSEYKASILEQTRQTALEAAGLFTAIYPLGNRVHF